VRRLVLLAAAALLAALPANLQAQAREITGKVTVSGAGTPLPDATVSVLGQQVGVRTNEKGEYRLRVPAGDVTVLARAIGYKRLSVRVAAGGSTADFSLEKDVLQLEGVVVTGQATTVDRRNASTAIATVSAEELNRTPAKSVEGQLAGKVVGARISENSGTPGGGMQVQIRGATSILGQGDPLYVVDGIIMSNASIGAGLASITRSSGSTTSSQDQTVNRLADLNPNDIESIEVLKSAAASAIYGSRATNGVVVITTKKGSAGSTKWNVTQRLGTQNPLKLLGSRRFANYAAVAPRVGSGAGADSVAKANCGSGACPYYDWQGQLYGQTDPSYETVVSTRGGSGNTRFYGSINDRLNKGIQVTTGSRRTDGRLNIDQTLGEKLTLSVGLNITHNFTQNGIGNNDNAGVSPIYNFGYSPAIMDLKQRLSNGHYVPVPFNGGGSVNSNPFEVLENVTSNEEVWRQMGNIRANYSLLSSAMNTISISYLAGIDRFQDEGTVYSPNYMQYEPADGFLGTSTISNVSSMQFNQSINAVWSFTPRPNRWLTSLQTSVGGTYETQKVRSYGVRARGLLPTRQLVTSSAEPAAVLDGISEFRDQSYYVNEQIIGLDEKLSLSAGVRADRSSANGDRATFYAFPKFSASYRFVKPLSFVPVIGKAFDEIKLRGGIGQSGNRPNYGARDVLIGSGGIVGGSSSFVASTSLGNPAIKPENMNETEFGVDGTSWNSRIAFELTSYRRVIKDLLLTFPLPASSGLSSQIINGGQMSTHGIEGGITFIPVRTRDLEWQTRFTYNQSVQTVDVLPVPAFNAPGGSFGASYGRNRIAQGTISSKIWGNTKFSCIPVATGTQPVGSDGKPCRMLEVGETLTGSVTRDSIIADANPRGSIQWNNAVTYKNWSFSALLDWRNGGYTSTMTKNLFDEGGQSADFDNASPVAGKPLGQYRYDVFSAGDIRPYVEDGTYVKLREITVTYDAPRKYAEMFKARDLRISLSGRNLAMWSKYWSFDPEFNNFGNQNFNRFIDLAPYPAMRQFFLSIDLGY
jgi:TonB-linked SusC/RagA family outer membrane protein